MARPIKTFEEKRSEIARCRLTIAERAFVRSQAEAAGLSEAEYLRRRALGVTIQPPRTRSDPALVSELNRIGVNVNQLARATHRGADFARYWREVGTELSEALAKLVMSDGSEDRR